jgi:hypothetical protein
MSAFEAIDAIVESVSREELNSEAAQLRFLSFWWSKTYSRPLKDPLLKEYTLEELYYEFKQFYEREKVSKERTEQETDSIEKAKEDDALAWAEAEEKKENENAQTPIAPEWMPTEQDKSWMEEQLKQGKELYGEDFGEDISEDF